MFILPVPRSPGGHGADDGSAGLIARARRSFPLNIHMGVNGFILTALLIQTFSIAGVMPGEVWRAEPGYGLTVCFGLAVLSACILFSLRSLLTQAPQQSLEYRAESAAAPPEPGLQHQDMEAPSSAAQCRRALVIEDNRTTQIVIEKSLAKAGIGCVCLRDGSGAQQALSSGAFDLIIVNASERDDGVNVAARLADGIPILALAAEDASELPTFADAIVTMPIAPRHLARTALDLIEQTSPRATPRKTERTRSAAAREIPKLEPEPLDARALGDLDKLGGSDFVRDIVAQFVADAASVLAGLTAAVAARDSRAFREQAHALRSCAANVGAQNVYRMCLAWRDLDAQEIATSGAQYMTMLEAEFERVRGALAPMLQSGGGSGPSSAAA